MVKKVAVIGGGSWGTTFAKVLADSADSCKVESGKPSSETILWCRSELVADEIASNHTNSKYLPGIKLPKNLNATANIDDALSGAEQVFLAVPGQSLRTVLSDFSSKIDGETALISLMKGLEVSTKLRMTQVISELCPGNSVAVLSGPNLALEIANQEPTGSVLASDSEALLSSVSARVSNSYFNCDTSTDVIGVEFSGVLKNLIAVAVGIAAGLEYGQNCKSSVITKGLQEITSFAVSCGAEANTMIGLAGLGDLIATCESSLSRNHRVGRLIAEGLSLSQIAEQLSQTAEGISSVSAVLDLAKEKNLSMPLVEKLQQVMNQKISPAEFVSNLITQS